MHPSHLSIKCCDLGGHGQAGWSEDPQVNLLGKLYQGDVVVKGDGVEVLVVGVLCHTNDLFFQTSLSSPP